MNCALWLMNIRANVRATGQKNVGMHVIPATGAAAERLRHYAERLLEKGANYD
jgi:hypothetical protein